MAWLEIIQRKIGNAGAEMMSPEEFQREWKHAFKPTIEVVGSEPVDLPARAFPGITSSTWIRTAFENAAKELRAAHPDAGQHDGGQESGEGVICALDDCFEPSFGNRYCIDHEWLSGGDDCEEVVDEDEPEDIEELHEQAIEQAEDDKLTRIQELQQQRDEAAGRTEMPVMPVCGQNGCSELVENIGNWCQACNQAAADQREHDQKIRDMNAICRQPECENLSGKVGKYCEGCAEKAAEQFREQKATLGREVAERREERKREYAKRISRPGPISQKVEHDGICPECGGELLQTGEVTARCENDHVFMVPAGERDRLEAEKQGELSDEIGEVEGDRCNRGGCPGVLELEALEGCTCFKNPPCTACMSRQIECPVCRWSAGDEPEDPLGEHYSKAIQQIAEEVDKGVLAAVPVHTGTAQQRADAVLNDQRRCIARAALKEIEELRGCEVYIPNYEQGGKCINCGQVNCPAGVGDFQPEDAEQQKTEAAARARFSPGGLVPQSDGPMVKLSPVNGDLQLTKELLDEVDKLPTILEGLEQVEQLKRDSTADQQKPIRELHARVATARSESYLCMSHQEAGDAQQRIEDAEAELAEALQSKTEPLCSCEEPYEVRDCGRSRWECGRCRHRLNPEKPCTCLKGAAEHALDCDSRQWRCLKCDRPCNDELQQDYNAQGGTS